MCSLAQKWSLCLLDGWLNSQREPFSWCLLCSAASTYSMGTGESGMRSYRCGVTREHLAPRGRWDSSRAARRWMMFLKDKVQQQKGDSRPSANKLEFSKVSLEEVCPDRKMLPGPSIHLIFLFPCLSWLGSRERPSSVHCNFSLYSYPSQQLQVKALTDCPESISTVENPTPSFCYTTGNWKLASAPGCFLVAPIVHH